MADEEIKPPGSETPPPKTFTQQELDAHIKDRLTREREKFADYDSLKQAAEKLKGFEDSQKTEAQKLADRLAEIERSLGLKDQTIEKLTSELTGTKRVNLVASVAGRLNAIDPQDANILAATASIDPAGASAEADIEAAIKALVEKKPYLFRKEGTRGAVEPFNPGAGGGAPQSDRQRVERLYQRAGVTPFG